ncbi:ABC transporter substrate-binding protein [bacterium]|nr:ABC transporter substrate-binding protein [bacterium]
MKRSSLFWCFLLLLCLVEVVTSASAAERVAIAVPELVLKSSFVETGEAAPYQEVLRSAAAPPLGSPSRERPPFLGVLSFLSGVQINPEKQDHGVLKAILREELTFANGSTVQISDVLFSLNLCMKSFASDFSPQSSPLVIEPGSAVNEVVFRGRLSLAHRLLGECPVLEKESGETFEDLLGTANFFVGLGPYYLSNLKPGVRVVLNRTKDAWTNLSHHEGIKQFVAEIEVRKIEDPRRALTALRYGSVDLVFAEDQEVRVLADQDQTLEVGTCRGFSVFYRRGLQLDCEDARWVARLRY